MYSILDLAIRWAQAVLGNGSCLVARCLLTRSGRFCRSVLRRQIFVLQQEFLIDCSGDIGEQARPKHLGFLLYNFAKARLWALFLVEEAYSKREPVQNPKRRDFKPFECFDHTPLAEPPRPAKMKIL